MSRIQARREEGAVAVIVALIIVALMGVMVLVVDVGWLLTRRIAVQNAADAAALAAAISCGTREGPEVARVQADTYTVANATDGAVSPGFPRYTPDCNASRGLVTIEVQETSSLFFAPVLGADTAIVRAQATASWGGAGVGENIAPLMLSAKRLTDCQIPPPLGQATNPQTCHFYWDNSSSNPQNPNPILTNAEWGTLDLNNWNVPTSTNCNQAVPGDFETWMFDGFTEPLPIDPPPDPTVTPPYGTTYVCRGQGNFGNSLNTLIEQAITDELVLYFPVNDPLTQVDRYGVACTPGMACSVDKYNIIGFARLRITQLWSGKQETESSPCIDRIGITPTANSRCMEALWTSYTTEGLNPEGGENFGLVPVRLVA